MWRFFPLVMLSVPSLASVTSVSTIESLLVKRTYQCHASAAGEPDWNFEIGFERYRAPRGADIFVILLKGTFSTATESGAGPIKANTWESTEFKFSRSEKDKFAINVGTFPDIAIFHHGRPRHFRGQLGMTSGLESIAGQLTYKVGRHGEKAWLKRPIQCTLLQVAE